MHRTRRNYTGLSRTLSRDSQIERIDERIDREWPAPGPQARPKPQGHFEPASERRRLPSGQRYRPLRARLASAS